MAGRKKIKFNVIYKHRSAALFTLSHGNCFALHRLLVTAQQKLLFNDFSSHQELRNKQCFRCRNFHAAKWTTLSSSFFAISPNASLLIPFHTHQRDSVELHSSWWAVSRFDNHINQHLAFEQIWFAASIRRSLCDVSLWNAGQSCRCTFQQLKYVNLDVVSMIPARSRVTVKRGKIEFQSSSSFNDIAKLCTNGIVIVAQGNGKENWENTFRVVTVTGSERKWFSWDNFNAICKTNYVEVIRLTTEQENKSVPDMTLHFHCGKPHENRFRILCEKMFATLKIVI